MKIGRVSLSGIFKFTHMWGHYRNLKILFVYLAYFPATAFWILDGYFLWQERLFRALYDNVRSLKDEDIDFSMDTSIVKDRVVPWIKVIFSKTLLIFHGTILEAIIVVMLIAILSTKGGQ